MAYSSDSPQTRGNSPQVRGFVPPQNEDEKRLMHRVEELCHTSLQREMPRYTAFLSDREQALAVAAVNRCGCTYARFWGGWENAERKILCLEPPDTWQEEQIAVLKISVPGASTGSFSHRDLLGAVVGLGLKRDCTGDILLNEGGTEAYLFALENQADFIAHNLTGAGKTAVCTTLCEAFSSKDIQLAEPQLYETTVPSLRADAVLAAMMHTSRGIAVEMIGAGRVEVNHVPLKAAHETVFENDIFTVRGVGRFRLVLIGGKSRKDRIFVSFYKY